jgi:hypothetical protein
MFYVNKNENFEKNDPTKIQHDPQMQTGTPGEIEEVKIGEADEKEKVKAPEPFTWNRIIGNDIKKKLFDHDDCKNIKDSGCNMVTQTEKEWYGPGETVNGKIWIEVTGRPIVADKLSIEIKAREQCKFKTFSFDGKTAEQRVKTSL